MPHTRPTRPFATQKVPLADDAHDLPRAVDDRHRTDPVPEEHAHDLMDWGVFRNGNDVYRHDVLRLHRRILSLREPTRSWRPIFQFTAFNRRPIDLDQVERTAALGQRHRRPYPGWIFSRGASGKSVPGLGAAPGTQRL